MCMYCLLQSLFFIIFINAVVCPCILSCYFVIVIHLAVIWWISGCSVRVPGVVGRPTAKGVLFFVTFAVFSYFHWFLHLAGADAVGADPCACPSRIQVEKQYKQLTKKQLMRFQDMNKCKDIQIIMEVDHPNNEYRQTAQHIKKVATKIAPPASPNARQARNLVCDLNRHHNFNLISKKSKTKSKSKYNMNSFYFSMISIYIYIYRYIYELFHQLSRITL